LKLLSIGDNSLDDYAELGKRFPGGQALDVAVYVNRINGFRGDYMGVLGSDEAGDFLFDQIRREGLDTNGIVRLPGASAITTILVRDGERVFAKYVEGVQKDAKLPEEFAVRVKNYDLVHYTVSGTMSFGRELIPEIRKMRRILISCDFSNEFGPVTDELMPFLDYSFFSGRRLKENGEDPEKRVRDLKTKTSGLVVMTLGKYGSVVYDGERFFRGEAERVEVVDTLGAGDAYIAAFLCARMRGATIEESIRAGHHAAAPICRRLGAWGGK
jgi:fructoselysine 6-kinase